MATADQITLVRLNIADKDSNDFTDVEIEYYIDLKNSVSYASYRLIILLIPKLRNQLLEKNVSGEDAETLAPLKIRLELLLAMKDIYEADYNAEIGNDTGIYIATTAPTIAGGDI